MFCGELNMVVRIPPPVPSHGGGNTISEGATIRVLPSDSRDRKGESAVALRRWTNPRKIKNPSWEGLGVGILRAKEFGKPVYFGQVFNPKQRIKHFGRIAPF